jgi:hypothetical protein
VVIPEAAFNREGDHNTKHLKLEESVVAADKYFESFYWPFHMWHTTPTAGNSNAANHQNVPDQKRPKPIEFST